MRKSHKPIWAWRLVRRAEGSYITGNIQLQIAANLITSVCELLFLLLSLTAGQEIDNTHIVEQ
jgi:hypothetical protein